MSEPKVALITGITGQDGSYLTELLLEKGYIVSFCILFAIATAGESETNWNAPEEIGICETSGG